MELPFSESWKIKMVEPIRKSTREEREQWLKEANYNVFQLAADQVYIDCLTDSGTGAMSDRQWAAMMMGDESYAGAKSFFHMRDMITRLTGFPIVIPTHQGRAAENVLFSALVKEGDIVPGNSHFDTTKGHIESRKAFAVDCTIDEARDTQLEHPFKGSVDIKKLEKVLMEGFTHKGFSFFDIHSNCHINLGRKNKMGEAVDTLKWIENLIVSKKKYDALEESEKNQKYPTGILHHNPDAIEYCKAYKQVQEKAQAKKGGAK